MHEDRDLSSTLKYNFGGIIMTAKWEKVGTNDGILTFTIPQDAIEKELNHVFSHVKKDLNLPGFRKGHVTRKAFDRMYGEEALFQDAANNLLPVYFNKAVDEAGIEPVAQPQIEAESMEKGQDWVMKAKVIVRPEVKLGEYKNLEVEKQNREVTDEDVDNRLKEAQEREAELVVTEEPAKEGDTVVIDFEGFKDGEAFDGGKGDNYSLELGSHTFIPGFEEQLVGVKAGDDVDVNVTFPEDYQAEELAGQPAVFKVKVHEVKAKEIPALDDELAKDLDDTVENLAELKEKYRKELEEQRQEEADEAVKNLAIQKAVENAEIVELPQEMIDEEVNNSVKQFEQQMQQQGISPEMYFQLTGTTEEDLRNQFAGEAEQRVRTNLVLEAIMAAEDIEATDEDVEKEVEDLSSQYNLDKEQIRAVLTEDMLKHDIRMKRAVDMVTSSAKEA